MSSHWCKPLRINTLQLGQQKQKTRHKHWFCFGVSSLNQSEKCSSWPSGLLCVWFRVLWMVWKDPCDQISIQSSQMSVLRSAESSHRPTECKHSCLVFCVCVCAYVYVCYRGNYRIVGWKAKGSEVMTGEGSCRLCRAPQQTWLLSPKLTIFAVEWTFSLLQPNQT